MSSKKSVFFKAALCLAMLLPVSSIYAQTEPYFDEYRTFYGGLIAGGTFTQVDGDNFAGYSKTGFNIGGIVYSKMDEHLFASVEVLYTQKGARSKGSFVAAPGLYINDYGITLNYAEIPFMISYFDRHGNHFGGGASYSRLGTSKEHITTFPPQNIDLNDFPFKKNDYNILLGGNLRCWKGLFLNIRFQYSILSIRDKTPQNYGRGEQFNNMWTIRMMYLFK